MQELILRVPDEKMPLLRSRASHYGFSDAEAYVRDLIEADLSNPPADATFSTAEELESLLIAGLDSGEPAEMTSADWAEVRGRIEQRAIARREA